MYHSIPAVDGNDHLRTLVNCQGYYDCPQDPEGRLMGPLVGYAGTYGSEKLHYVGARYFNVAQAEQWPHVIGWFANQLGYKIAEAIGELPDVVLGAPMGGIVLGQNIAQQWHGCRFIFAEKVSLKAGEDGQRATETLILGRHEIHHGERVGIAEDIANNFTTTLELLRLVVAAGGIPVFLSCVVNRSDKDLYVTDGIAPIPVISLVHQPTPQYQQDDPVVAELVQAGNVIWKPKHSWAKLWTAMERANG